MLEGFVKGIALFISEIGQDIGNFLSKKYFIIFVILLIMIILILFYFNFI
ncbi:MAG: hypothetical protein RL557_214 [archaeon]|jgi:hypothetical protein